MAGLSDLLPLSILIPRDMAVPQMWRRVPTLRLSRRKQLQQVPRPSRSSSLGR